MRRSTVRREAGLHIACAAPAASLPAACPPACPPAGPAACLLLRLDSAWPRVTPWRRPSRCLADKTDSTDDVVYTETSHSCEWTGRGGGWARGVFAALDAAPRWRCARRQPAAHRVTGVTGVAARASLPRTLALARPCPSVAPLALPDPLPLSLRTAAAARSAGQWLHPTLFATAAPPADYCKLWTQNPPPTFYSRCAAARAWAARQHPCPQHCWATALHPPAGITPVGQLTPQTRPPRPAQHRPGGVHDGPLRRAQLPDPGPGHPRHRSHHLQLPVSAFFFFFYLKILKLRRPPVPPGCLVCGTCPFVGRHALAQHATGGRRALACAQRSRPRNAAALGTP